MENKQAKILMLGLNDAGKSTYLAALYYALKNSDEISETASKLYKLSGNERYIVNLQNKWLEFEAVGRTSITDDPIETVFHIENSKNKKFDLIIPDLSGEMIKNMIEVREKSSELNSQIINADGFIIFISCANFKRATSILSLSDNEAPSDATSVKKIKKDWNHSFVPTQVKIVELLQFLAEIKNQSKPIKISLILSAWDRAKGGFNDPGVFLKSQLPLLQQFLDSNQSLYSYNLFGISAQGIDYTKGVKKEDLAKNFNSTISRISVIYKENESHDISAPIDILIDQTS